MTINRLQIDLSYFWQTCKQKHKDTGWQNIYNMVWLSIEGGLKQFVVEAIILNKNVSNLKNFEIKFLYTAFANSDFFFRKKSEICY